VIKVKGLKKTAEQLRAEAAALLERAKKLENERATKIGKLIIKYEANGFEGFTLETLKNEIAKT
jgi:hypothetical protein